MDDIGIGATGPIFFLSHRRGRKGPLILPERRTASQPSEQEERALGVGAGGFGYDQDMHFLPADPEHLREPRLVSAAGERQLHLAGEFVPQRSRLAGSQHLAAFPAAATLPKFHRRFLRLVGTDDDGVGQRVKLLQSGGRKR